MASTLYQPRPLAHPALTLCERTSRRSPFRSRLTRSKPGGKVRRNPRYPTADR